MTGSAKNLLKLLAITTALAFLLSCASTEKHSPPQTAKVTTPTLLPSQPQPPLFVADQQSLDALAYQNPFSKLSDVYGMDSLYAPNAEVLSAVEKLKKQSGKDWLVAVGNYQGAKKTILHRKDCLANLDTYWERTAPRDSFALEKLAQDFFKDNAAVFQLPYRLRFNRIVDYSSVIFNTHLVASFDPIYQGLPIFRQSGIETGADVYIQPVQAKAAICTAIFINPKIPESFSIRPVLSKDDAIRIAKQDYLLITQKKHIRELEDAKRMSEKAKNIGSLAYHQNEIDAFASHTSFKPGRIELGIEMDELNQALLVYRIALGVKGLSGGLQYVIDATNGKIILTNNLLRSSRDRWMRCGNTPDLIKGSWW